MFTLVKRAFLAALLMSALMVLLNGSSALASYNTPNACDSVPKYYCSYVNYDANINGGWNINHRYYEGATDGGAQRWQLFYAKDWYSLDSGQSWILQTNWGGDSNWYTNTNFDTWRQKGSAVSIRWYSTVTIRNIYYECTDHCYYWCSLIMQHNLWNQTSLTFGTGSCNPA